MKIYSNCLLEMNSKCHQSDFYWSLLGSFLPIYIYNFPCHNQNFKLEFEAMFPISHPNLNSKVRFKLFVQIDFQAWFSNHYLNLNSIQTRIRSFVPQFFFIFYFFYFIFFNFYLVAPQLTLGDYQGDCLTHRLSHVTLITASLQVYQNLSILITTP